MFDIGKEVNIDAFKRLVEQCFDARLRSWKGE